MPRGIPIQVKKDQIHYVLNNINGVLKSGAGNQAGGRPQKPRESLCENKKKAIASSFLMGRISPKFWNRAWQGGEIQLGDQKIRILQNDTQGTRKMTTQQDNKTKRTTIILARKQEKRKIEKWVRKRYMLSIRPLCPRC